MIIQVREDYTLQTLWKVTGCEIPPAPREAYGRLAAYYNLITLALS